MQKRNLSILLLVVLFACKQESKQKFEVSGKIMNAHAQKIYLEEAPLGASQAMIVDSANIGSDGSFQLKASPKEETLYAVYLKEGKEVIGQFINDAPSVTVSADLDKREFTVSGSTVTNSLKEFVDQTDNKWSELVEIKKQMDLLKNTGGTDSMLQVVNKEGKQKAEDAKKSVDRFINESRSPVASFIVLDRYMSFFSEDESLVLVKRLAERFPAHQGLQSAKEMYDQRMAALKKMRETAGPEWIGKQAPEISLPDVNGQQITLSSFRGKYVLVDFWASWCKPCRAENPNVVKAYNQFKNKNFTILGVSLDAEKEKWVKAIQQDGLTWTHVSDLKQWNSQVVPVYGFGQTGIPFNVLVDPSGKVIAQALRGETLEQKLAEVLQ